jgi:histidinol dehydrogenase
VISRVDLRGSSPADLSYEKLSAVLPRAALDVEAALDAVRPICEDVRVRGAAAIRDLTARFDGVHADSTLVPHAALAAALDRLDPAVREALEEAVRRVRLVHEAQLPAEHVTRVANGSQVTERYVPVRRVGLYVPGGLVAYPSSVVMNVVPAQVAGVGSIALASPPQRDPRDPRDPRDKHGLPHPAVLAACALLGVAEVHAVGGAQAIAMFAYGTADCAAADMVTGPGNVYVAAAKRLLRGRIGTDAEAGPTEVAIIADDTADPAFVAADLVAQAEHDELAACLHITPDPSLADRVDGELARQVPAATHRARIERALAGQSAHVLVDDIDAAIAVADAWAPEHLEIQTKRAHADASRVRNAGAIFVGPYAPVSLGDYLAGSNHVLPTGGTARHTGGLSVKSFLRGIHVVECDAGALADVAGYIDALGGSEDLTAHVTAVKVRLR